jgi:hypothetical protein
MVNNFQILYKVGNLTSGVVSHIVMSKCLNAIIIPGHLLGKASCGELTVHSPERALACMNSVTPTARDQWQTMLVCHH